MVWCWRRCYPRSGQRTRPAPHCGRSRCTRATTAGTSCISRRSATPQAVPVAFDECRQRTCVPPGYPVGARWLAVRIDRRQAQAPHGYLSGAQLFSRWLGAACAAVLIWRLAADEADAPIADRAVLILLAGPYAVFLMASYSEGVFLAFALAAWLAGRRDRWWLAGLMAGRGSDRPDQRPVPRRRARRHARARGSGRPDDGSSGPRRLP